MDDRPTPEDTARWQRRIAAQANNQAWTLAEAPQRSADEEEDMLQAAHAAMHLWKIVGNELQRAHAALLLAHVYALLRLPNPAAHYLAKTGTALFAAPAQPWEQALAHAVAANVAAARGDAAAYAEHLRQATEGTAALADPEERSIIEATLRVLPKRAPPTNT